MKRIIALLLIIATLLCACTKVPDETATPNTESGDETVSETKEPTPPPREVTVTDSAGREVTTSAENGDIVSTSKQSTSVLIALNVGARLTGVESTAKDTALFTRAYPDIAKVTQVTNENGIDTDAIIAQKPGLVVLANDQQEYVKAFESAGITCAVVALDTIDNIKDSIELVGKLVNSEDRATEFRSYYSSALTRLKVLTMTEDTVNSVSVHNNDPFITSMLSNIECNIEEGASIVIARNGEAEDGMIAVPDSIELWDEPTVALVLGIYWYTYHIYPDIFSDSELYQRAVSFYKTFYDIDVTEEEVGFEVSKE